MSGRRAGVLLGALTVAVPAVAAADAPPVAPAVPAASAASAAPAAPVTPERWPLFDAYAARFVSDDGRVIDHTGGEVTTSEGQSYGLFFSLVAGDRARFERLLRWTESNLAQGSLAEHLPATRWGKKPDGGWGILDPNSAADSDLWIGYALVEAGRLWRDDGFASVGRALLAQVVAREVVELPALGPMLLPAPYGFVPDENTWRLNPSYLPLSLLAGLDDAGVAGPWRPLRASTLRLLREGAPHGFAADWIAYRRGAGFVPDPVTGSVGSYDAIRVYLWASLLADGDPDQRRVNRWLDGMARTFRRRSVVPERVDCRRRDQDGGAGPVGFLAVLLPRVAAGRDRALRRRLDGAIEALRDGDLYGHPVTYYDQNLMLFARGHTDGWYRFDVRGHVVPRWAAAAGASPPDVATRER